MTVERPSDSCDPADPPQRAVWMSGLMDGEAPADDVDRACAQWRSDPELRRQWHAYHLIGDALRSDDLADLAMGIGRDADFLQALKQRLETEPVPLAPTPIDKVASSRRWLTPVAAAAGVAAVGVSVLVLKPGGPAPIGWGEPMAVMQPAGREALRQVGQASAPASTHMLTIDGQVIRDARLDAYFEAHRGAAGAMPSAVPGGALRSVEILVPQRR